MRHRCQRSLSKSSVQVVNIVKSKLVKSLDGSFYRDIVFRNTCDHNLLDIRYSEKKSLKTKIFPGGLYNEPSLSKIAFKAVFISRKYREE